jgi:hypothetical protein
LKEGLPRILIWLFLCLESGEETLIYGLFNKGGRAFSYYTGYLNYWDSYADRLIEVYGKVFKFNVRILS